MGYFGSTIITNTNNNKNKNNNLLNLSTSSSIITKKSNTNVFIKPAKNNRILLFSSKSSNNDNKNKNKKSKKIKINPNWEKDYNPKALSETFDKIAKEEGFDNTLSYYDDEEYTRMKRNELLLKENDVEEEEEEEDILLANYEMERSKEGSSMADRIARAEKDLNENKITTTFDDDNFTTAKEIREKLGIKYELDPFGNDETPRNPNQNIYKLISNPLNCPACGAKFQSNDEDMPGYIPEKKLDIQTKLGKIDEARLKFERRRRREWNADDEVDWLLNDKQQEEEEEEEF